MRSTIRGHKRVIEFNDACRAKVLNVKTIEEHDTLLIKNVSKLHKRDTLWILGDVGNIETFIMYCIASNCKQINFVPGNHDSWKRIETARKALPDLLKVHGCTKYKGNWITHIPIHPDELYGRLNIHGHLHGKNIENSSSYINVSVEQNKGIPVNYQELIKI